MQILPALYLEYITTLQQNGVLPELAFGKSREVGLQQACGSI